MAGTRGNDPKALAQTPGRVASRSLKLNGDADADADGDMTVGLEISGLGGGTGFQEPRQTV